MDKRQKKRILIFLIVPVLAAILFITDDLLIRVITIAVMIIYVAFIIFLRDSVRFDGRYSINENEDLEEEYKIGIKWSFLKPLVISMVEIPEHLKLKE